MGLRVVGVLAVLPACSSILGLGEPGAAPPDGVPASCLIAGFDLCANQPPTGPITFGSVTLIDTTLDCNVVLFDPDGGSLCVIYGSSISVEAAVTATGRRPVVFASTGAIQIAGSIDVSSHDGFSGAGGDPPSCAVKTPAGTDSGGGAGGSFHGKGGDGGAGTYMVATAGRASDPIAIPTALRGGCKGGAGSNGIGGNFGVGLGGGAVAIIGSTTITVTSTGSVLAGGGGAPGASFAYGAGGGGSGGMIQMSAPAIAIAGIVNANGGGGGEGHDASNSGANGANGSAATTAALGGHATAANGGDGGNGGAGTMLSGTNATNGAGMMSGGGGGGGGTGFVLLASPSLTTTGTITPPAS